MTQIDTQDPRAADSGANATKVFEAKAKAGVAVSTERVNEVAGAAIAALNQVVRDKQVTYEEYDALKAWCIKVGQDGEWPLFLDVWIEHVVEEVNTATRGGSKGTIEGPYYIPDAPVLDSPATLPMRDDEPGTPLLFSGTVRDIEGRSLPGALVDIWLADDDGYYSQFAPNIPEWNLRAQVNCDQEGRYEIAMVRPAPYQIPTDGSCGALIAAAGWSAWRPAHIHLKVSAPDHQMVTSQLYFDGGDHITEDVADAVKPELVLRPQPRTHGEGEAATYDFVLDRA